MIQSLYLHEEIVDVLKVYGKLDDVINRALDEIDDYEDKPDCGSREGCNRYNVNVTNEQYLQLLKMYGVKSKRISLRRFVYWFVDNELYNELGWEPTNDFVDKEKERRNKQIDKILAELDKLQFICKGKDDVITHAKDLIIDLRR